MKEDILNKSVSDIRLRSLQKCINKTDSLIFNRDNSIVHIKKTNSIKPFNNTNLGVNFSCNKYGNLETYVDNSGTSVAVSANDIKGSNKEIKKVCNNVYENIFTDKRMHTNDRRGVRFGSVDCVNINSNNIYSNTRKNVTFNTKIYDDQDYFYNSIDSVIDDSDINLKTIDTNTDSCFIFKNKDSITDYLYNKNKDHFFINTSIVVTDQNGDLFVYSDTNLNTLNLAELQTSLNNLIDKSQTYDSSNKVSGFEEFNDGNYTLDSIETQIEYWTAYCSVEKHQVDNIHHDAWTEKVWVDGHMEVDMHSNTGSQHYVEGYYTNINHPAYDEPVYHTTDQNDYDTRDDWIQKKNDFIRLRENIKQIAATVGTSIIRKCNLFKLTKTDSGSTTSFQLFEPNRQFIFGYGPDAKQLTSHNVYNVYSNIFNISCTNPARNETHVDTEPDYWGTQWNNSPYDRWEWHSQHPKIININTVYTNEMVHGFNNINLMSFIMKYINRPHENDIEKKSFFGIYSDKKIANAYDAQNYIKANNNTITSSILTKKISFAENRYSQCGSHIYSPGQTETGGVATMGGTYTYTSYQQIYKYKSRTRDTYNCIFPFGFALSNAIKTSNIESLSKNEIETIDSNVVSIIKKFNALNFLTIDKENLTNNIEFTDTLDINDATIDNHTYKIETSIQVL